MKRRKFASDARGAVAVLIALAAVPLIGTDRHRRRFGARLHRPVTAVRGGRRRGARRRQRLFRRNAARRGHQENLRRQLSPGYLDASVSGPTITADEANQKITVDASATIPVTFMRLFGHETVTVGASAEVTRKMKALEVVLSMDVSGSMGNKDRASRSPASKPRSRPPRS